MRIRPMHAMSWISMVVLAFGLFPLTAAARDDAQPAEKPAEAPAKEEKPAADDKEKPAEKAEEKPAEPPSEKAEEEAGAKKAEKRAAGILDILKLKEKKPAAEQPAAEKAAAAPGKEKAADVVEVKLDDLPAAPPVEKSEKAAKAEKREKKTKKGEKKEAGAPPRKKDPEQPMFRLRDGTRLTGMPELKTLNVATPYGKLVVPIAEVVRVRFAATEDPKVAARIADGVKALGSEEFDRREEAMAALREVGPPALDALKKALSSEDEEVKTRAEKLVNEIEEGLEETDEANVLSSPLPGDEDEVVTLKFVVKGRVEEEGFQLATRYGALKLGRKDIVSVVFREPAGTRQTFPVPGGTFAGANKWVDTKVAFSQGERLHITATGQINMENFGQSTGPEGTTSVTGNSLNNFPAGALVGRLGDKGQPFVIGAEYDSGANASGSLFLGISLQNGNVSGQYEVEVEKEGET